MLFVREDLAWAAGFYDGEGCTGVTSPQSRQLFLRMCVSQAGTLENPPDTLLKLKKALLGMGFINGPRICPNRKPMWIYHIRKFEHVQAAIGLLWNWLGESKKKQIQRSVGRFREGRRTRKTRRWIRS